MAEPISGYENLPEGQQVVPEPAAVPESTEKAKWTLFEAIDAWPETIEGHRKVILKAYDILAAASPVAGVSAEKCCCDAPRMYGGSDGTICANCGGRNPFPSLIEPDDLETAKEEIADRGLEIDELRLEVEHWKNEAKAFQQTAHTLMQEAKLAQPSAEGDGWIAERVAQLTAHRACHSAEHDPLNGRIHGYCIVCGVPWPCEYAGTAPVAKEGRES